MSERITRVSLAEAVDGDRTDWVRLGALTDQQIDAAIEGNTDSFAMQTNQMSTARYSVYQDGAGQWRWRLTDAQGQILARSGGSFRSRSAATTALAVVRAALAQAKAA